MPELGRPVLWATTRPWGTQERKGGDGLALSSTPLLRAAGLRSNLRHSSCCGDCPLLCGEKQRARGGKEVTSLEAAVAVG